MNFLNHILFSLLQSSVVWVVRFCIAETIAAST